MMTTLTREQIEWFFDNCRTTPEMLAVKALALRGLDTEPRPIEEAPKDGTKILAWWGGRWLITYWVSKSALPGWKYPAMEPIKVYDKSTWKPTHFIPLSALPEPKA